MILPTELTIYLTFAFSEHMQHFSVNSNYTLVNKYIVDKFASLIFLTPLNVVFDTFQLDRNLYI